MLPSSPSSRWHYLTCFQASSRSSIPLVSLEAFKIPASARSGRVKSRAEGAKANINDPPLPLPCTPQPTFFVPLGGWLPARRNESRVR